VNATGQSAVFGRRKEPHTVIIARGNEIRHFTIRPWLAAFIGSALAAIAIGYLLATSYLVLRDDLIGATTARQARMQQAYEDRISALRAQVDRITSRQLLDQQLMENKVSELIERQTQLSQRHGRLGPLLERAENEVGAAPAEDPVAAAKPDKHAEVRIGSFRFLRWPFPITSAYFLCRSRFCKQDVRLREFFPILQHTRFLRNSENCPP